MLLAPKVFGTKVARRVFLLFVLASFAPITATVVLMLVQVTGSLESRAYQQLSQMGRGTGQIILDKLLVASEALGHADDSGAGSLPVMFDAVAWDTGGGARPLFGRLSGATDLPPMNDAGTQARLWIAGNGRDVLLARQASLGPIVGLLKHDYLWSAPQLLPYGMSLCVFPAQSPHALYCSDPLAQAGRKAVTSAIERSAGGQTRWSSEDGIDVLAAHWQLFIPSRFHGDSWHIVISQPRDLAMESLTAFNRVFPFVILASVVTVLLLSVSQIRRSMTPLKELLEGTKRIADRRFAAPVRLSGNDEFSDLAIAMNTMAAHLGRQFDTLTTLAEIDRLILRTEAVEQVLETVLERIGGIVPHRFASILLIDAQVPERGNLYRRERSSARKTDLKRVEMPLESRQWLASRPRGGTVRAGDIPDHVPVPRPDRLDELVLVAPILKGQDLRGALLIDLGPDAERAKASLDAMHEIATRLAVAIAATERERELFERAHFDMLTGLPNRQLCHDRLQQALARAHREHHSLAVLFLDLDGFKSINDSLGHSAGDQLLRKAAERLVGCMREADTVARLGGDEYLMILPRVDGSSEVQAVLGAVMARMAEPFRLSGSEVYVSASVGVTMYPDDGDTAEELLRRADTAMYGAKDGGRARYMFFAPEMDRRAHDRLSIEVDLRYALERKELHLVYQPLVALPRGRICGTEALLRWQHPRRGLIGPEAFVPTLERTGLIEAVGEWTLRTALGQLKAWRAEHLPIERVAVNISAHQLARPGFIRLVEQCLEETGLPGDRLELELTESIFVEDFESSNAILKVLRARGVRISVDDFGTGYSSFGYLKDLLFDSMKIDRAFIRDLPEARTIAIVRAIIAVARTLEKTVVAEGVETELQLSQLIKLGCNVGQGYLFSRPMSARDLRSWILETESLAEVRAPSAV